jgi:hypothetical protein
MIRWSPGITLLALKLMAYHRRTAFRRDDPRTVHPGRGVAGMLEVSAFQFSYPMIFFVLVEADDTTFH